MSGFPYRAGNKKRPLAEAFVISFQAQNYYSMTSQDPARHASSCAAVVKSSSS